MAHLFDTSAFRVTDGARFSWKDHPTALRHRVDEERLQHAMEKDRANIADLQALLYAERQQALLLIFQAMDAAGKDSAIAHVLSGVNPQGCRVWNFKAPTTEELGHDFLWRHACSMPERGIIGVHNRSHYEEVLVVKVHPEYLAGQRIPGITGKDDVAPAFWKKRYASIRNFEEHLARQGVVIMKFHLHMDRKVQKQRFLERIDDPAKNWKFSAVDVQERVHWDEYRKAYRDAIVATAAPHAPWFIVPADRQWESRAIVCRLVREQLEAMQPKLPKLPPRALKELKAAAIALRSE